MIKQLFLDFTGEALRLKSLKTAFKKFKFSSSQVSLTLYLNLAIHKNSEEKVIKKHN